MPSAANFGIPSIADRGELPAIVRLVPSASTLEIDGLAGLLSASG